jgi:hypothetical protein
LFCISNGPVCTAGALCAVHITHECDVLMVVSQARLVVLRHRKRDPPRAVSHFLRHADEITAARVVLRREHAHAGATDKSFRTD